MIPFHILSKPLSNTDRLDVVELTQPSFMLYTKRNGSGTTNDYLLRIITAVAKISPEDREKFPLYTKNCVFTSYSDCGDNGKRKNQHAEMIETLAHTHPIPNRVSVFNHTFQPDYILYKALTYVDP